VNKRTAILAGAVAGAIVIAAVTAIALGGGTDSSSVNTSGAQSPSGTAVGAQPGAVPGGQSGGSSSGQSSGKTSASGSGAGTTSAHPGSSAPGSTTPTTIHNTIKPLPGRPKAPYFDTGTLATAGDLSSPTSYNDVGICYGNPPHTYVAVQWYAYNTDYVQVNRGATEYPPQAAVSHFSIPCPSDHSGYEAFASVVVTAFGPGGEVSDLLHVQVDRQYRP
jgi:hypothetical protein